MLAGEAKRRGIRNSVSRMKEGIKPEYHDAIIDALREPYVFMKHGSEERFDHFTPETNEFSLLLACIDYMEVYRAMFPALTCYMVYAVSRHPDVLAPGPLSEKIAAMADETRRAFGPIVPATVAEMLENLAKLEKGREAPPPIPPAASPGR